MSEDLEELDQLGLLLFQNKKWDEAIEVCTEIIRLENDPERKAAAYTGRGIAYNFKGDPDRAIANCDKAIELYPQGSAAYSTRSVAYHAKKDYDRALADCDKAIALNPQDAAAYGSRGLAYVIKGDYDRTFADCDKAIALNPQDALAHCVRGFGYRAKCDYASAFDNFLEAGNHNKIKSNNMWVYIAYSLAGITSDREKRARLFEPYCKLADAIQGINAGLFCPLTDGDAVTHYTSLDVLRALAKPDNPFRLHNADSMDDSKEGQVFFEIMQEETGIGVEGRFYKPDSEDPHSSPAYIGSFVKIESQDERENGKLSMWCLYGKHDKEEAAGACLIFNKDQFAQNVPLVKIGDMLRLEDVAQQGEPTRQNAPPALYMVVYKSEIRENPELLKSLGELALSLKEIEGVIQHHEKHEEILIKLGRELLDGIRFLFKADDFRKEQEVRVIQMSYDTGGEKPPKHLDIPGNVRFSEVILGPRTTHDVSKWQHDLGDEITVRKSEIKFGQADQ